MNDKKYVLPLFLIVAVVSLAGLLIFNRQTLVETAVDDDTAESTPAFVIDFLGVESGKGEIIAALYDNEVSFENLSNPIRQVSIKRSDSTPTQWVMQGIEPGNYAVAAFFDLNKNSKLDKNSFGIPIEQYGFSNNPRGKFGPPKFEECLFQLSESSNLEIQLK